jgi:DNA polymerase-3 subunit delta'
LIDQIDRANEQAANSMLKTLEEPPEHLILVLTAANTYDLLPTIRSRAVPFHLTPLGEEEMRQFCASRGVADVERRIALAAGSPGAAISIDLEAYLKRRTAMLALLESASGRAPFSAWVKFSESIGQSKSEKLEHHLQTLYLLLQDLLAVSHGHSTLRNHELRPQLEALAPAVSFEWIVAAVKKVDELNEFLRRNIQKGIALDALVVELRSYPKP